MKQTKTIFLISKIREKANKFILADLAQHGITKLAPSHGDILACLYQRERVTMKEISDSIHTWRYFSVSVSKGAGYDERDFRLYPSDETNGNGARK